MITRQEAMLRLVQESTIAKQSTPDYTSNVYESARKALISGLVPPSQLQSEAITEANYHSVNAASDPAHADYHNARFAAHKFVADLMGQIDPNS